MFATRSDLLARSNARRLAQLAVPADVGMVRHDALRIAIEGGSLSVFSAADQASLTLALDAIDTALVDAYALILSHGIPAEPLTTPVALSQLKRMSTTLAVYYLQGAERISATDKHGYDDVVAMLKAHSRGDMNLVPPVTPPVIQLPEDQVLFVSAPRRYGSTIAPGDW